MNIFCLPWHPPSLLLVEIHLQFVKELLLGLMTNPQSCLSFCCSVPEEQLHNIDEYDLNVVRLCFQAFLPDEHGNYTLALPPLISNPIYDNSKYQLSQMCNFFFPFCFSFLLGMKNARPVPEVCASPLGHFCGLGLLDACLTHSKSVSVYSKDDPRVKGWPTRVRIVQYSHGLTRGCFCSPCSHVTAMTARKGLLLKCQAIKINSKMDGCRKTDLFSKDVL